METKEKLVQAEQVAAGLNAVGLHVGEKLEYLSREYHGFKLLKIVPLFHLEGEMHMLIVYETDA